VIDPHYGLLLLLVLIVRTVVFNSVFCKLKHTKLIARCIKLYRTLCSLGNSRKFQFRVNGACAIQMFVEACPAASFVLNTGAGIEPRPWLLCVVTITIFVIFVKFHSDVLLIDMQG
jgi:hypothetical protein